MNGILDDYCHLLGYTVLVRDCEQCLSDRKCDPVCLYRGFVWGRPDERKPLWVHRYEATRKKVLAFVQYHVTHET